MKIQLYEKDQKPPLTGEAVVKIVSRNEFVLNEKNSYQNIKFEIFPGIIGFFTKKFIIQINEFEFTELFFSGTAVLPQIIISDIERKVELNPLLEYEILQKMFNETGSKENEISEDFEISKKISSEEPFCKICGEKFEQTTPKITKLKKIVSKTDFSVIDFNLVIFSTDFFLFFILIETLQNDVPSSVEISKYIIQEYFVKSINSSKLSQKRFERFVDKFIRQKTNISKIQALPFVEPSVYVVDIGEVEMNDSVQLILNFSYSGPWKLKTSMRTDVPIPDLNLSFAKEDFCTCNL